MYANTCIFYVVYGLWLLSARRFLKHLLSLYTFGAECSELRAPSLFICCKALLALYIYCFICFWFVANSNSSPFWFLFVLFMPINREIWVLASIYELWLWQACRAIDASGFRFWGVDCLAWHIDMHFVNKTSSSLSFDLIFLMKVVSVNAVKWRKFCGDLSQFGLWQWQGL